MNYLSFYLISISAGAIAWIIIKLFVNLFFIRINSDIKNTVQIILFFIILGGFRAFAFPKFIEKKKNHEIEMSLLEYPLFKVIKQKEPQTFDYILTEIIELQQQDEVSAYKIAQQKIHPIFMQRLLATSDENLLNFTKLNQRFLERLYQQNKFKECVYFSIEKQQDSRTKYDILTAEETQQRLDIAKTVFLDDAQMTVPPKSLIEPIVKDALVNLFTQPEKDYSWLFLENARNPIKNSKNNRLLCQLSIDVNSKLLSLPKHQSAAILRYLYSGQSLTKED